MKILTLALLLTTLLTTVSHSTEIGISAQAIIDARADAENDVNEQGWVFFGCCLTGLAVSVAVLSSPEVPIDKFIGKPPEYIYFYSEEYRRKVRELRLRYTAIGWLATTALVGFVYVVLTIESTD